MHKIFLILLVLLPVAAFAAPVEKPPEIAAYIHAAAPYGQGELKKLWIKAYDATLWTDAPSWSMDAPFALSMRYALGLDTDDLVGSTMDEMANANKLSKDQVAAYQPDLNKVFLPVKQGDTITAVYLPHKGTFFYHDGQATGAIADPLFAKRFFAIWFSPDTSQPKLRQELLGDHGG